MDSTRKLGCRSYLAEDVEAVSMRKKLSVSLARRLSSSLMLTNDLPPPPPSLSFPRSNDSSPSQNHPSTSPTQTTMETRTASSQTLIFRRPSRTSNPVSTTPVQPTPPSPPTPSTRPSQEEEAEEARSLFEFRSSSSTMVLRYRTPPVSPRASTTRRARTEESGMEGGARGRGRAGRVGVALSGRRSSRGTFRRARESLSRRIGTTNPLISAEILSFPDQHLASLLDLTHSPKPTILPPSNNRIDPPPSPTPRLPPPSTLVVSPPPPQSTPLPLPPSLPHLPSPNQDPTPTPTRRKILLLTRMESLEPLFLPFLVKAAIPSTGKSRNEPRNDLLLQPTTPKRKQNLNPTLLPTPPRHHSLPPRPQLLQPPSRHLFSSNINTPVASVLQTLPPVDLQTPRTRQPRRTTTIPSEVSDDPRTEEGRELEVLTTLPSSRSRRDRSRQRLREWRTANSEEGG